MKKITIIISILFVVLLVFTGCKPKEKKVDEAVKEQEVSMEQAEEMEVDEISDELDEQVEEAVTDIESKPKIPTPPKITQIDLIGCLWKYVGAN